MEDVDHLFAKDEETRRELSVVNAQTMNEKVNGDSLQHEVVESDGSKA